jgi:hypothetical protein
LAGRRPRPDDRGRRGVGHRIDGAFAGHYSLLQTIEQNFGLPLLGNAGDLVQVGNLSALLK